MAPQEPTPLAPVEPGEQVFLSLAPSANTLLAFPPAISAILSGSEPELSGDGSPMAVAFSPWRWGGPKAGEIVGSLTFRRWDGHVAFDLVCTVTVDPDEHALAHIDVVVRLTEEARLVSGQPPLGTWWATPSVLTEAEARALRDAAADVAADPPARSFALDTSVVRLRLVAGSLGVLAGELRFEGDLGLAYVRATEAGTLTSDAAARALRAAVVDGRLAVPTPIRAWLEHGGDLLAVEGGPL